MRINGPGDVGARIAAESQRLSRRLATPGVGGFTLNPRTGRDVEAGISVSDYGSESRSEGVASPAQIQEYGLANAGRLAETDVALGGWHPANADESETEDASYLDISRVYPDRRQAMAQAVHNAQQGIYHMGGVEGAEKGYIPTEMPPWTSMEEQAGLAEVRKKAAERPVPDWLL